MSAKYWCINKAAIPDGFLQSLIDLYIQYGICDKDFVFLLNEKLDRNEI